MLAVALRTAAQHVRGVSATQPLMDGMLKQSFDLRTSQRAVNIAHLLLRVMTGALFMQHGLQKLFGVLVPPNRPWSGAPGAFTQTWIAGILETFGGPLIAVGFLTRPLAFLLAGEMAVAYFKVHAPRSFFPVLNSGETVVLFCFIMLYLSAAGAGPYSVDAVLYDARRARSDAA